MNNKWVQVGIAICLWIYLAVHVVNNVGILGGLVNKFGHFILPDGLAGLSGSIIVFAIFSLVYAVLGYIVFFKLPDDKK